MPYRRRHRKDNGGDQRRQESQLRESLPFLFYLLCHVTPVENKTPDAAFRDELYHIFKMRRAW